MFVFIFGVMGYMLIEKWPFIDALYMTIITLTTIGFQEVRPLSVAGRMFTIIVVLLGIGVVTYTVSLWITFLIEGHLGGMLKKRKMNKEIKQLKNHYIICASGEIGVYVIEEFYKTQQEFVVISNDEIKILPWVKNKNDILYIESTPENDEVLKLAGIEVAKGVVCVLNDDRDNLYVTLSARQLNPNLRIVTQSVDPKNVEKIKKAGADEVVSATEIGGMRIASTMLRPVVVKFLDLMLYSGEKVLRVEEIVVPQGSEFVEKQICQCEIPKKTGLLIVAVKEASTGKYIFNPSGEYVIRSGDVLIVIGNNEQINKIKKSCINS
ncbi:MAG: NAD-binding protein [Endomicrobia bacterium]|nr:NAD-binding protein [Endomicrobiia bacterium]